MALLYESVFRTRTKTVRAKSVSRQLQEEAPYWRVVEVYKVGSIYMTPEQLSNEIKKGIENAAAQKGLKIVSYRVLNMWAEWKGIYTEYFCRYEAIIGSGSLSLRKTQSLAIPVGTIIIVLAIVVGLLIILYIVLVARETIEGLFKWVPPEARPLLATALIAGVGILLIGGGVYLISKVIPKIKRK